MKTIWWISGDEDSAAFFWCGFLLAVPERGSEKIRKGNPIKKPTLQRALVRRKVVRKFIGFLGFPFLDPPFGWWWEPGVRPIFLLRLSLLSFVDSKYPGNSTWTWAFHTLKTKILLESNPLKSRISVIEIGRGVLSKAPGARVKSADCQSISGYFMVAWPV